MPKKKATSTNKTAHVMNLISKSYDAPSENPPEGSSPESTQQQAAPAANTAPPAVLPSLHADMEITSQIKSALEDLIEDSPASVPAGNQAGPEIPAQTSAAPEQNPQPEPEASAEMQAAQPQQPAEHETERAQEQASNASAPAAPVAAPTPQPEQEAPAGSAALEQAETPAVAAPPEEMIVCVNIMEELVDENTDRYIKMFGLCNCPKCVADVKALALNNLVPKYIVTPQNEKSPRIIIYNERYHAEVTAQILRACKTVMDNPLHHL